MLILFGSSCPLCRLCCPNNPLKDPSLTSASGATIRSHPRVPQTYPLRKLRDVADALLVPVSSGLEAVNARRALPSVLPEMLLKVLIQLC